MPRHSAAPRVLAARTGQIYVPWINWALMASVLTLVLTFKSSAALAYAFGMAVTGTITITTLLFFYIAREHWRWPLWAVVPGASILLAIDLLFFAANLTKLVHGAWLPLLIGIAVFTILTTWRRQVRLAGRICRHAPSFSARRGAARSRRRPPFGQHLVPPLTDRYAYRVYAYPLGIALR